MSCRNTEEGNTQNVNFRNFLINTIYFAIFNLTYIHFYFHHCFDFLYEIN